jgi:asparagine synthase (glutamine-hydrolysing)
MCGIAGFAGAGDVDVLRRMNAAQAHRGPDGTGAWKDPGAPVFLGHQRLSIVDIADGSQPMWTADSELGVVFNGEIYNHVELRTELKALGHAFVTDHSDTEVLLHGYRAWGDALPARLNGMWAFAVYDRARRRLFCSRDRFGKKPLYYFHRAGTFAFASELTALAQHPWMEKRISRAGVLKYFAYNYIPSPHSIYESVRRLPGGHSLVYDLAGDSLRVSKYWDFALEPFEAIPSNPEAEWGAQLRDLLDRAVKRRLMSDVPLGTFLSGGIDSSAVTAFAARHVPKGALKTFSIGFDEATFDESAHAQRVADLLGTDHHPERLSIEGAKALLPDLLAKLDEPMGDSSILPTYLLCGHTRRRVTVALGGDGADELFGGYDPFRALALARTYDRLVPKRLHEAMRLVMARLPVSHRYMSLDFRVKRTLRGLSYPPHLWCPVWMASLDPGELQALFSQPVDLEEVYSEAIAEWEACRQPNLIDRTLQFYTKLYLQDDILVKVDRASMMHSLEARAPFLDIELVDFVRRIPGDYKFRNGETKYILKRALEPVLPREVLYRSKQGFGVPIGKWFQEGAFQLGANGAALIHSGFVRDRLAEHRSGRIDQRAFLWNAWILENWQRTQGVRASH